MGKAELRRRQTLYSVLSRKEKEERGVKGEKGERVKRKKGGGESPYLTEREISEEGKRKRGGEG